MPRVQTRGRLGFRAPVIQAAGPRLSAVNPTFGSEDGGTEITITGANLINTVTAVTIGGVSATSVVHVSDRTVTCTTPAGTGTGTVSITIGGKVVTGPAFTYQFTSGGSLPADVVFVSDWSTGTGTGDAARRDTGKSLPWDTASTTGAEIVSSAGLDFPTTNVAQITAIATTGPAVRWVLDESNGDIPLPGIGESIYYRWYTRIAITDSYDPSDNAYHPQEDGGGGGSQTNWGQRITINTDGTLRLGWQLRGTNTYPNNRYAAQGNGSGVLLNKDQTYRVEYRVLRTGAGTMNIHSRIYDSSGTLLYDDGDFWNLNSTVSLESDPSIAINILANMQGFAAGSNGFFGDEPESDLLWAYLGGVMIRTDDWCGPYDAQEASF